MKYKENKPVRLNKKDLIAVEYKETTVYSTGAVFNIISYNGFQHWNR